MDSSNNKSEQNNEPTNVNVENPSNQGENAAKSSEPEPMVQSPAQTSSNQETKTEESNLINLTIKTPKEKENVALKPDATIKDVRLIFFFLY